MIKLTEKEVIEIKNILQVFSPTRKYHHWSNNVLTEKPVTSVEPRLTINPKTYKTSQAFAFAVCMGHNISYQDFIGPKKHQDIINARIDFCYLCYEFVTKNKSSIARSLNRKHNYVITNLLKRNTSPVYKRIKSICCHAS